MASDRTPYGVRRSVEGAVQIETESTPGQEVSGSPFALDHLPDDYFERRSPISEYYKVDDMDEQDDRAIVEGKLINGRYDKRDARYHALIDRNSGRYQARAFIPVHVMEGMQHDPEIGEPLRVEGQWIEGEHMTMRAESVSRPDKQDAPTKARLKQKIADMTGQEKVEAWERFQEAFEYVEDDMDIPTGAFKQDGPDPEAIDYLEDRYGHVDYGGEGAGLREYILYPGALEYRLYEGMQWAAEVYGKGDEILDLDGYDTLPEACDAADQAARQLLDETREVVADDIEFHPPEGQIPALEPLREAARKASRQAWAYDTPDASDLDHSDVNLDIAGHLSRRYGDCRLVHPAPRFSALDVAYEVECGLGAVRFAESGGRLRYRPVAVGQTTAYRTEGGWTLMGDGLTEVCEAAESEVECLEVQS